MARAGTVNLENLTALGLEKLAQLVFDGAGRDAAFRKMVAAAMAGAKGPKAIAALVDRRLAALERAKAMVEWNKTKAFGDELAVFEKAIVIELGKADPSMAAARLLRFIACHEAVFERIDDSSGRIQSVYHDAIADLGPLLAAMPEADRALVPDQIMALMAEQTHGYLTHVVAAAVKSVPPSALRQWDADLARRQAVASKAPVKKHDWSRQAKISQLIGCRQEIASALGDLDGFIALELTKEKNAQDPFDLAERLFRAGRYAEALGWIKREGGRSLGYITHAGMADGTHHDAFFAPKTALEAAILEKLGRAGEGQTLRWDHFKQSLNVQILRDYVAKLGDFDEFDALDRAFAHVAACPASYEALGFFLEWPRLDLAAKLVIERRAKWSGAHYSIIAPAAKALEDKYPAAATILFRALLDDILVRGKSPAYGHGARYLVKLKELAPACDAAAVPNMETHAAFSARIDKSHGRKAAFWALMPS